MPKNNHHDTPETFTHPVDCIDFIDGEVHRVTQVLATVMHSCRALSTVTEMADGFSSGEICTALEGFAPILKTVIEQIEHINTAADRMHDLAKEVGAR